MDYKEQGLAIRGARLERRMTQAHLAGLAGVSEKTIRRAEGGERLQADSIRAVCAALGIDASELRTEAEMRPDVAAEIASALVAQAVRVRLLAMVFAVASVATGVFVAFRADPTVWEFGRYAVMFLIGAFFLPLLADSFLLVVEAAAGYSPAMRSFGGKAKAGQAWIKSRRWAWSGTIAAAVMPVLLAVTSSVLADFIRTPSLALAGLSVLLIYFVLNQAIVASNTMLDLDADPVANDPGPISRWLDRGADATVRWTVQPLLFRLLRLKQGGDEAGNI